MKRPATSPTGWWIAGLLHKHSDPDRAPYWNNYRLIRAHDWRTAFQKAHEMGKRDDSVGNDAFSNRQEFIGISDLLPIYDGFEDGAEVLWQELWPDDNDLNTVPLQTFTESDLELKYQSAPT